jgi:probable rRNA maturation factor
MPKVRLGARQPPVLPRAAPRQRFSTSTVQRFNISLANRQRARAVDARMLRRIVTTLLGELLQISRADLGICLVATPEMAKLNETFLRHKGPTDVITFDYAGKEEQTSGLSQNSRTEVGDGQDARPALHGEIFVCVEEAVIQARRFRTSWQSELVRYAVHGLLHLRGFDDRHPAARRKMKREENRLLRRLSRRFCLARLAGAKPRRSRRFKSRTDFRQNS